MKVKWINACCEYEISICNSPTSPCLPAENQFVMQQATPSDSVWNLASSGWGQSFLRICHRTVAVFYPYSLPISHFPVQLGKYNQNMKIVILYLLGLSIDEHQWRLNGETWGKSCLRNVDLFLWLSANNFDALWPRFGHHRPWQSHCCPHSQQTKCLEPHKDTSETRVRHFSETATLPRLHCSRFSHLHYLLYAPCRLSFPLCFLMILYPFSVVYVCVCCVALSRASVSDVTNVLGVTVSHSSKLAQYVELAMLYVYVIQPLLTPLITPVAVSSVTTYVKLSIANSSYC